MALSAALGFRSGYLEDVLRGCGREGCGPWLPCGGQERLDGIAAAVAGIGETLSRMEAALGELAARQDDGTGPRG